MSMESFFSDNYNEALTEIQEAVTLKLIYTGETFDTNWGTPSANPITSSNTVYASVQPTSLKEVQHSAGMLKQGDAWAYFHSGENVLIQKNVTKRIVWNSIEFEIVQATHLPGGLDIGYECLLRRIVPRL